MQFAHLEGVLKQPDPERGRKLTMVIKQLPFPGMILQVPPPTLDASGARER